MLQALEQELRELDHLQNEVKVLAPPRARPNAATPKLNSQQTADAADILSAALEDPHASLDDILGVLDYVIAFNGADQPASVASSGQTRHPSQAPAHQPQAAAAAAAAAPAAAPAAATVEPRTAREMAAQLLEQARTLHAGVMMSAACGRSASAAAAAAGGNHHLAATSNAAGAGSVGGGAVEYTGRDAAATRSRSATPPRCQLPFGNRMAARCAQRSSSRSPLRSRGAVVASPSQDMPSRPHDVERMWRQGLRAEHEQQHVSHGDSSLAQGSVGSGGKCGGSSTGPTPGVAAASPSPPRLRRDTPELDERLERLYARNLDWRRRCEAVYQRQRAAEADAELDGCTFAPAINRRSELLAQVRHQHWR